MTVYSEVNKITYIGSSEQTLYPIPFEYINNDNIVVSIYSSDNKPLETWTYSTEYVVEGNNVRVLEGYQIDNSKKMLIERKLDIVQDNKYREGGDFPAKSTEISFDKLTMIAQQQKDELSRCPKVDSIHNINLTLPAPEAGKALIWNEGENGFRNSMVDVDELEAQTKDYRDQAEASKNAAQSSEANAKASELSAAQSAQSAANTVNGFDDHAAEKQSQFDTNVASKTNEYNTNAQTKLDSYNSNATNLTNTYNTNASTKTTAFNDNYTNKLNSFNSNATSKKDEFNANAIQKQEEVDTSAEEAAQSALIATTAVAGFTSVVNEQTNIFNSNASSKTADFNDNYTNKLNSFNTNAASKQSQVDESADLAESWAIGDINNRPEGSAKYWAEQASGGQIQADWSETDLESKAFIKNKPTKLSQFTNDVNFVNETQLETKQDVLTTKQLSAVNSGITSNKVSTYDGYSAQISARQLTSNLSQTIDTSTSKYPSNNAVRTALNAKAPLASPAFTGTVTFPSPSAGDNSTKGATTAWVKTNTYRWGVPNYSAGVSVSSLPYTAPSSGVFLVSVAIIDSSVTGEVKVNGQLAASYRNTYGQSTSGGSIPPIIVNQGDLITVGNCTFRSGIFYPFKGV